MFLAVNKFNILSNAMPLTFIKNTPKYLTKTKLLQKMSF
jgi:hypothetical protein